MTVSVSDFVLREVVNFSHCGLSFVSELLIQTGNLTDLKLDAVVLPGPVKRLFHHACVLVWRECAGGIYNLPAWTSCFNARSAGGKS